MVVVKGTVSKKMSYLYMMYLDPTNKTCTFFFLQSLDFFLKTTLFFQFLMLVGRENHVTLMKLGRKKMVTWRGENGYSGEKTCYF